MEFYDFEILGKILENIHPSITIADRQGVFVYVGTSCSDFFGVEPKKLLGKSAGNPEVADIFRPCVTELVFEKKEKIVTVQKNINGTETLVTGIPIFSDRNELAMIIAFSSWEITSYEDLKNSYDRLKKENKDLLNQLNRLTRDEYINMNVVGESKSSRDAIRLLKIFSSADVPAYVYGPNGSGKKYLAKVTYGNRGILCEYNCNLLSEENVDRELFGNDEAEGLIHGAVNKTIIIQNIDQLTPVLQRKLVNCIRHREVNIVCIAEKSLEQLKAEKRMIEDFYYLFKSYQVQVYAISERAEDLNVFLNYYLDFYNMKYDRKVYLSPKAMNCLLNYDWPENINEIKYTMERMVLTAEQDKIDIYNLPKQISDQSMEVFSDHTSLKDMMDFYEKGIITRAYEKYRTTTAVAEHLGISQASAVRKINKWVCRQK